jgi:hypothetical protein
MITLQNGESALGKIKVGDKVRYYDTSPYLEGEIGEISNNGAAWIWHNNPSRDGGQGNRSPSEKGYKYSWWFCIGTLSDKLEILNSSEQQPMSLSSKFNEIFLQEPEKTFRKAGVTNESGMLTDDGQKIFLSWMLRKNGAEFKTEIVDKLVEVEEKK